jgi:hypothetical protein
MLMGTHEGSIEGIIDPDDLVVLICLGLDLLQEALPGAVLLPAAQPVIAGGLGRIALGQVLPGRAGAQDPQNAIEHRAMIGPGMAGFVRMSGRQQRGDAFPLLVGQFVASHELLNSIKGIPL